MAAVLQICPSCGMPAESGAVFCENCGETLQEGVANSPSEPQGRASSPSEPHGVRMDGSHGELAPPSDHSAVRQFDSDAPFVFEWDCARQFLSGSGGAFAYRMRFVCNLDSVELSADIDGDPLLGTTFSCMQVGEIREGTFAYTPKTPGTITVNLHVKTTAANGVEETFEPKCPLCGMALSGQRVDVLGGAGTVNINAAGNTGINRFDGVDLGGLGGVKVDRWNDERSVFGRPAEWRTVSFASCGCGREIVRLHAGNRALTVIAGTEPVSFGRSARRATVRLVAETANGQIDESRSRFVSGVHFTIVKRGSSVTLRDGGPEEDCGRKVWRKSSNGMTIDGAMAASEQALRPGSALQVVLAPYAVPGGALSLSLEANGHASTLQGCDRACELASVTVRRADAPNSAGLVVWGSTQIDGFLGTQTGLTVGLVRGRLRLIFPDGRSHRLVHLVGQVIPGTDISVQ